MKIFVICILLLGQVFQASTQDADRASFAELESELLFYGDVMVNGFESSTRQRAAQTFEVLFQNYLSSGQAFSQEADFLKFISILDAPDNKFKLISWIKNISDEVSDYSGYLFYPSGEFTQFKRTETLNEELAFSTSTKDNWYGCLYYKIMKAGNNYVLFGLDTNTKYDNQKLIDILTVEGQNISFGKPVFEDKDEPDTYLNRLILRFSSDASVVFNYDNGLKMIVHDHLEPRMGLQPGQGPTNIPDGTYEGYKLEEGKWKYKKKLFDHVYESAPRPKPVFGTGDSEDNKPKK